MGLIDEKGRLFGKVNLLDLVVVLAVLLVAWRFGYPRLTQGQMAAPVGGEQAVEVVYRLANVADPTVKYVTVGQKLYDSNSNALVGEIVEVDAQPAVVVTTGDDGRVYERLSSNRYDVYVTVRGSGRVAPNSISQSVYDIKIGRTYFVKTREWAGSGVAWDIDTEPPAR